MSNGEKANGEIANGGMENGRMANGGIAIKGGMMERLVKLMANEGMIGQVQQVQPKVEQRADQQ